jgi:hypothetical protein
VALAGDDREARVAGGRDLAHEDALDTRQWRRLRRQPRQERLDIS